MEKTLLDILACPKCKDSIRKNRAFLTCKKCRLAFPILDSVPNMLLKEAWPLKKARKAFFRHALKL